MRVEIHGLNNNGEPISLGTLSLADGEIVIDPDSKTMRSIRDDFVYDAVAGECYSARRTPEDFLKNLHKQYHSAYLSATQAIAEAEKSLGIITK